MVIVRIQKIIWTEEIISHIKKHNVTVKEAEEVITSDSYVLEGHSGKKILVSRVGSRILSVVTEMTGNKLKVKTARDSDKHERQGYYEFEKSKNKT